MTASQFHGHEVPDQWVLTNPDVDVELAWQPTMAVAAPQERPAPARREPQPLPPTVVDPPASWRHSRGLTSGPLVRSLIGGALTAGIIGGGWALLTWYTAVSGL